MADEQTVSLIGNTAVQFLLTWRLANETALSIMMSIAGVFAFLLQLLSGPFTGARADRLNRKIVIMAADLFIGLTVLIFTFFLLFGNSPYWSVCLVLGARAVGNVSHSPTTQAVILMLVPQQELVRANGWSQFVRSGAFLLGPVLGTTMHVSLPFWIIPLSDLANALVASTTVALVRIPDPKWQITQRPHSSHGMEEGATTICQDRKLLIVTVATLLGMVFYAPLSTYYPFITGDYFRTDAWHASTANLGYASRMMLYAILLGGFGTIKNKFPVIHLGFFGMGIPSSLCDLPPARMFWFWVFTTLCALFGAGSNLYNVPYISYTQEIIASGRMGRTFSLIGSLTSATMLLGLFIVRPIAKSREVPLWFPVSGVVPLLLTPVNVWLVLVQRVDQAEEGIG